MITSLSHPRHSTHHDHLPYPSLNPPQPLSLPLTQPTMTLSLPRPAPQCGMDAQEQLSGGRIQVVLVGAADVAPTLRPHLLLVLLACLPHKSLLLAVPVSEEREAGPGNVTPSPISPPEPMPRPHSPLQQLLALVEVVVFIAHEVQDGSGCLLLEGAALAAHTQPAKGGW